MSNTILADVLFYNMRTVIENDGSQLLLPQIVNILKEME